MCIISSLLTEELNNVGSVILSHHHTVVGSSPFYWENEQYWHIDLQFYMRMFMSWANPVFPTMCLLVSFLTASMYLYDVLLPLGLYRHI